MLSDVWTLLLADGVGATGIANEGTSAPSLHAGTQSREGQALWTPWSTSNGRTERGHASELTSLTFDGKFSGHVEHAGSVELAIDDRVRITFPSANNSSESTVLENQHVFDVGTSTSFRFISRREAGQIRCPCTATARVELLPAGRSEHAAAVLHLDAGETMVVYGGV